VIVFFSSFASTDWSLDRVTTIWDICVNHRRYGAKKEKFLILNWIDCELRKHSIGVQDIAGKHGRKWNIYRVGDAKMLLKESDDLRDYRFDRDQNTYRLKPEFKRRLEEFAAPPNTVRQPDTGFASKPEAARRLDMHLPWQRSSSRPGQ
jgi:hypothetical protein